MFSIGKTHCVELLNQYFCNDYLACVLQLLALRSHFPAKKADDKYIIVPAFKGDILPLSLDVFVGLLRCSLLLFLSFTSDVREVIIGQTHVITMLPKSFKPQHITVKMNMITHTASCFKASHIGLMKPNGFHRCCPADALCSDWADKCCITVLMVFTGTQNSGC